MESTIEPATIENKIIPETEPIRLKTRKEEREYLAKHLKPIGFGPKGQPLYAKEDIDSLNVILPDDL